MQRCAQYQIFQKNISKYQFVWFKILIDNNKKNIKENSEKKENVYMPPPLIKVYYKHTIKQRGTNEQIAR